ncbi:hypothetical protein M918_15690 [Clostridium sp. BL8]|nr:hypothetical protein M918_15690 [Clostridium sp. BL8]
MNMSLKRKLSLGFLAVVICSLIITSLISNLMITKRFNEYLVEEHRVKINEVVAAIEDMYSKKNKFQGFKYDEIRRYAELNELYIEIVDINDNKVYTSGDAHLRHRNMMETMMGRGMGQMMGNMGSLNLGDYKEEKLIIKKR